VDARVHAGFENARSILCLGSFLFTLSRRHFVSRSWLGIAAAILKKNSPVVNARLMSLLVIAVFLPILACDPRFVKMDWVASINAISAIIVLASLCPFCAILGYLTSEFD